MKAKQWTQTRVYQPVDVTQGETVDLWFVKKGWRVLSVTVMPLVAAGAGTTSTIALRDALSFELMAPLDTETMTPGVGIDSGPFLGVLPSKYYNADNSIRAVYATGATPGATKPKVRYSITLRDERY